ncbi:hypothetical protein ABMA28_009563 [Loxostege sticticalis]|uniref:Retrotransposon gag domain-containing protein n=1 Tax=Loxostege sticticalis TaxID=481309 RepID=A0ABD0SDQ4_LOXSC
MSEPGEGDGGVKVGLPPTSARPTDSNNEIANTSVNGVPAEFFSQMLQMMKHVSDRLVTLPDSKVKINDVFLPSYDPDANIGVREWCQHVTTAMETYNLSDYDVRMKAGSLLKGRARLWVDNWLVSTTTWEELRDVLITTFEPENRYSRDVVRFREHNYDHSKDIAQFLSQAWVLWRRITKDKLSNDDAVEAVIGCIGDERLRIELTLKNALTMIKNYDTENWQTALEALQLAFNCTPHRITGVAPLTLLTRRQHCVPPELLRLVNIDSETIDFDTLDQHVQQKMAAAAQYEKLRFDRNKAKLRPFQRGDYVLIKNNPRNQTSLDLKYSEPYEIYRILDNDRYMVKRVTGRGRPRKVAHDQLRRAPQPGEQETESTGNNNNTQQHTTSQQGYDSSAGVNNDTQQQTTGQPVNALVEPLPSTSQAAQVLDA